MILPIYAEPQPVLHQPATPIKEITPEIRQLADDMLDTMRGAQGIGLAAPQVGQSINLIVLGYEADKDDAGIPFLQLVNPRITWTSPKQSYYEEGCLSLPGLEADVRRPVKIRVKALTVDGKPIRIAADGLLARILQHEIDHLHGILFTDRVAQSELRKRSLADYPRI